MIIQVRHSSNTGNVPISLEMGELALNSNDQLLYYKHANGALSIMANGASLFAYSMAQVSSNLSQLPANTNPYRVTFNSNDILIGMTHAPGNSRVIVSSSGWYTIGVRGQLYRTIGGGNLHYADFWFRKNGVDITKSATRTSLKNVNVFDIVVNNLTLRMNTNDYIELIQAVDDATQGMGLTAPVTLAGGPSIPSVIMTITKISN
jgi:hypothetical protein